MKIFPPHPLLRIGIGDDAAVLRWPTEGDLVVTTDAVTDEVDFVLAETDPRLVGHKVRRRQPKRPRSDGGGTPGGGGVARAAAEGLRRARWKKQLAISKLDRGMLPLAEQFNVAIAGGDTNSWGWAVGNLNYGVRAGDRAWTVDSQREQGRAIMC